MAVHTVSPEEREAPSAASKVVSLNGQAAAAAAPAKEVSSMQLSQALLLMLREMLNSLENNLENQGTNQQFQSKLAELNSLATQDNMNAMKAAMQKMDEERAKIASASFIQKIFSYISIALAGLMTALTGGAAAALLVTLVSVYGAMGGFDDDKTSVMAKAGLSVGMKMDDMPAWAKGLTLALAVGMTGGSASAVALRAAVAGAIVAIVAAATKDNKDVMNMMFKVGMIIGMSVVAGGIAGAVENAASAEVVAGSAAERQQAAESLQAKVAVAQKSATAGTAVSTISSTAVVTDFTTLCAEMDTKTSPEKKKEIAMILGMILTIALTIAVGLSAGPSAEEVDTAGPMSGGKLLGGDVSQRLQRLTSLFQTMSVGVQIGSSTCSITQAIAYLQQAGLERVLANLNGDAALNNGVFDSTQTMSRGIQSIMKNLTENIRQLNQGAVTYNAADQEAAKVLTDLTA